MESVHSTVRPLSREISERRRSRAVSSAIICAASQRMASMVCCPVPVSTVARVASGPAVRNASSPLRSCSSRLAINGASSAIRRCWRALSAVRERRESRCCWTSTMPLLYGAR